MGKLSVVIPVWNRKELLGACLASLERALVAFPGAQVIVVDDASTDGAPALVESEFPWAAVVRNQTNQGFAHSVNRGIELATGDQILLLNSDTEIEAPALKEMVDFLDAHPGHAGVAPSLVDENGRIQESCMAFPRFSTPLFFGTPLERWLPRSRELRRYFLREFDYQSERDVEQPPAACWLLRHGSWLEVGEFDESLELFFNDVDWCRRLAARNGLLRYLPSARVLHHGGASTSQREDLVLRWQTDRLRYQRKHLGRVAALFTKLCVSWTFADWCCRNLAAACRGRSSEKTRSMGRAYLSFLRA
jgi:N-acetylglucosaminyl-diphospho-decaprenol L-rhamnosyltransferase